MWISIFVGLMALGGLIALDERATGRRLSRFVVVSAIPLLLLTMGYVFQRQTRTALGDVAGYRVTQSAEAIAGRLLPYGKAVEKYSPTAFARRRARPNRDVFGDVSKGRGDDCGRG